jgi:dTDP-4-amino-4,6-dideoxygalactose transaminase
LNIPFVDLRSQYQSIKPEIDQAIQRVLDNTSFILGSEAKAFEDAFSDYMRVKHTMGVSNGTDALLLAMLALGIKPGDEVIVPSHTFIATIAPIMQIGARPVFVEIDPLTYNIDPAAIEAAITPKTRAIAAVHLYGQPANMPVIKAIADKHNLRLLEDAAQAHGAEIDGQRIGSWGDVTCFSFYPGKNLGAYGEAGAVSTNNDEIAEQVRLLREHGSKTKYEHLVIGYNARIEGFQAAVLGVKLKYIEQWTELRRQHAAYYTQALKDLPGITTPAEAPGVRHVYHLYVLRVAGDRQQAMDFFKDKGVGVGIHYPIPNHLQPALAELGYKNGDLPTTEAVASSIVSLPMFPELTVEQLDYTIAAVKEWAQVAEAV